MVEETVTIDGIDFDAEDLQAALERQYGFGDFDPISDTSSLSESGDVMVADDGFDDYDCFVVHNDAGKTGYQDAQSLYEATVELLDDESDDESGLEALVHDEVSHPKIVAMGDETSVGYADVEIVDDTDETEVCEWLIDSVRDAESVRFAKQFVDDEGRLVTALTVDD
jgi:hypothetical protein